MEPKIRKMVHFVDETWIEGGRQVPRRHRLAAVAAVLENPWLGRGFVEDLSPEIEQFAPQLGALMVPPLLELMGAGSTVTAHGKAALVGLDGEIEHGCALIHTLLFGNVYRSAVGASAFIPSTNRRGAANGAITIPLKHIQEEGARSHFLTLEFAIPDAPRAGEIVVALGAADSGRPHHRIGDRYEDMARLGKDQTNRPIGA